MALERKTEPKLTEAAARTTAVLQTLQSRLKREAPPVETGDELGEELQRYFASTNAEQTSAPKIPAEIRNLVVEGVVDRILRSWGDPSGQVAASITSEVIGRLVERVLAEMLKKSGMPGPQSGRPGV